MTLAIAKGTLSMWETGQRHPAFDQLRALDDCYRADGALIDLTLALGTPSGLPPREKWARNFQGPSGPVWAWLRPRPGTGRIDALLLWGAFAFDCSQPCDDRGVFVTSPVSMPNPAVWVHLRKPGWVDFGRGEIPEQLQFRVLDALSEARVAGSGHSPAGLVAPSVVARFTSDPEFAEQVLQFFGSRPDLVRQVFSTTEGWDKIVDLTTEPSGASQPASKYQLFTGAQYCMLREARGLSQADAARLVTELIPDEPVTDDQIGSLERGGSPRVRFLCSRLDCVYRADGHTCREEVQPGRRQPPFVFEFPTYWVGPIWFTFTSDHDSPVVAELHWGASYKRMRVKSGTTVTCRRPTEEQTPFVVTCPGAWRVTAGMGMYPEARDVNFGWLRSDDDRSSAAAAQDDVNELFLNWFGRTKQDWARFLQQG